MNVHVRALIKVQFLMTWRGMRDSLGGGKSKWGLLLLPLLILSLVPLVGALAAMYLALYLGAASLGQAHLVLTTAFTIGQVTCLMFGVFYVISAFYFSSDLPVLVPLPIRPREIVLSKFVGIMAGQYLTMAPLLLPALVIYALFSDVSWLYWPFSILIYLLLPVLPLALSSLFTMGLMRVTNLRRNQDLWRVIGGLFGVLLVVLFQFVNRVGGGPLGGGQAVEEFLQSQQNLVEAVGRYFPTSIWATNALREGAPMAGAGSALLFAVIAVAGLGLVLWVAEQLFFGGLIGGDETRSSGKELTGADLARQTGLVRSPLWALVWRETRLLNRTPSFLMAAVLPTLLVPVLLLLPFLQNREVGELTTLLGGLKGSPTLPLIGIGVVMFMNAMSNVTATAISREGRFFWISRSLPVAPRVQIDAKLIHSLLLSALNLALVLIGLLAARLLTVPGAFFLIVGGLTVSCATGYGAILIDTVRPNLTWTDPQKAMKGNVNVLLGMLLIVLIGGMLAAAAAFLYWAVPSLVMPGILLLFGAVGVLLRMGAGALADRRYAEYED